MKCHIAMQGVAGQGIPDPPSKVKAHETLRGALAEARTMDNFARGDIGLTVEVDLSSDLRIAYLVSELQRMYAEAADREGRAPAYYATTVKSDLYALLLQLGEPPVELEYVGVVFKEFNSPADAAAHGARGNAAAPAPKDRVWSYGADPALKLTIGDRVIVPVGDSTSSWDEGEATVVRLNEKPYPYYSKNVIRRV